LKSAIIFDTAQEKEPNLRTSSNQHFGMASKFSLQSPYALASLPRPIDRLNGRYVVGEVFGGEPGPKKRRKLELAVGVDGEGVNLYDVSAGIAKSAEVSNRSTDLCF
jgi:hypothetical protein